MPRSALSIGVPEHNLANELAQAADSYSALSIKEDNHPKPPFIHTRGHAKSMTDMHDYMSHGHGGDRTNEVEERCNAAKHSADSQLFILMQLLTRRNSMRDSSARHSGTRQIGTESSSGAPQRVHDGAPDDACSTPPSGRSNPACSIPASFSPALRELPVRSPMAPEQQDAVESLRGLCNDFLELPSSLQVATADWRRTDCQLLCA